VKTKTSIIKNPMRVKKVWMWGGYEENA